MSRRPSVSDLAGGRERRCRRRPSVSDLTGGEKRRRRVPSVGDLTGGGERRCRRRPSPQTIGQRSDRWREETASHTIGQKFDRWGRDRETGSSRVYTCRECRDRHDVKHYRSAIHLIGSVWRRSRDRRPSLGAGVRTARPREGECRHL